MAVKVNVRDQISQGLISRILDRDCNAQLIAIGSYEGETILSQQESDSLFDTPLYAGGELEKKMKLNHCARQF